jgi:hypothetical protein
METPYFLAVLADLAVLMISTSRDYGHTFLTDSVSDVEYDDRC